MVVVKPAGRTSLALSWKGKALLFSAFVSGCLLLALEVVWFRFLILYINGVSLAFAIMLAVVLAGIGLGGDYFFGMAAVRPNAYQHLTAVALITGTVSVLCYGEFGLIPKWFPGCFCTWHEMLMLAVPLIMPVSFLSGILFTLIGTAVYEEIGGSLETTGLLTMANTVGAMLGSALACFVLIPRCGMETALFFLSSGYCVVGLAAYRRDDPERSPSKRIIHAVALCAFIASLALFPFGAMREHILSVERRYFLKTQASNSRQLRKELPRQASIGRRSSLMSRCTQYCSRITTLCQQRLCGQNVI